MKKVLIISYYWPPSGGSGVQRWLKMSQYLKEFNVEPIVLTVDEKYASYALWDESLVKESENLEVYKTKSLEVLKLYTKLFKGAKLPTGGGANLKRGLKSRLVSAIRSNFFIPDPRIGWKRYAVKKAIDIIRENNIKTVITTSPPHSTQLIGEQLKRKLDINWIVDFRDPWTDIFYYKQLAHSALSRKIDRAYEQKVLEGADHIIAVGDGLKKLFQEKIRSKTEEQFSTIPNGYDPKDFDGLQKNKTTRFTICYTGTIADTYKPKVFIDALIELKKEGLDFVFKLIGMASSEIMEACKNLNDSFVHIPSVNHKQVVQYQLDADLLLLVIPEADDDHLILTGKLFEYLCTQNPIINIGPIPGGAAEIIEECQGGKSFTRNQGSQIVKFLKVQTTKYHSGLVHQSNAKAIEKYSRREQAKELSEIIHRVEQV